MVEAKKAEKRRTTCPYCAAYVIVDTRNVVQIQVRGHDADEVLTVTRGLAEDVVARREAARLRSPWFSGLFYLTLLAVVIALLLTAGSVLPILALPIVIVGAVLLVSIVGALQMRQDEQLRAPGK